MLATCLEEEVEAGFRAHGVRFRIGSAGGSEGKGVVMWDGNNEQEAFVLCIFYGVFCSAAKAAQSFVDSLFLLEAPLDAATHPEP